MRELALKLLKSQTIADTAPAGSGLSTDAVGLVREGFNQKPNRFWMEMQLTGLKQEIKRDPFSKKVKTVVDIKITIHDLYLKTKQEKAFHEEVNSSSFNIGDILNLKDIFGKMGLPNMGGVIVPDLSGTAVAALTGFLESKGGSNVLDKALKNGLTWASDEMGKAKWATYVTNVRGKKIYLSGGTGCGLKIGDRLRAVELIPVNGMENDIEEIAQLEVTDVKDTFLIARIVPDPVSKDKEAKQDSKDAPKPDGEKLTEDKTSDKTTEKTEEKKPEIRIGTAVFRIEASKAETASKGK